MQKKDVATDGRSWGRRVAKEFALSNHPWTQITGGILSSLFSGSHSLPTEIHIKLLELI